MAKSFAGLGATIIDTVSDLPSSPVEGLMVFQKDTNELKIYDGSLWVSVVDTDTPNGLVLINSTSFTSSTGFNLDNVFSNTFKNYHVVMNGTLASTSYTTVNLQYRYGGTTLGGTSYYGPEIYRTNSAFGSGYASGVSAGVCGYWANLAGASVIDIFAPYDTTNTLFIVNHSGFGDTNNITTYGATYCANSTSFDGFRISSANAMTGNIRVYGYRNS
jgi:hypothetical protein